jgi:hypothetical protein
MNLISTPNPKGDIKCSRRTYNIMGKIKRTTGQTTNYKTHT